MPKAIFKVVTTKLAKPEEELQRVATRVPIELRQSLKIQAAVMGIGLNAMYAVALREFFALAVHGKSALTWKKPSTSPRADRHGGERGDVAWVQVLLILSTSLIRELEEVSAQSDKSLATVCYTALDWYMQQQALRQNKFQSLMESVQGKQPA